MTLTPLLETGRARIPWRWVFLAGMLAVPNVIAAVLGGSITFLTRRFIESPALINTMGSLDVAFNILVAATCLYWSDRIWTSRGRRVPFMLVAWVLMAAVLAMLPQVGRAWLLVPLLVIWYAAVDVGSVVQTLQMEIVPPHQRGRLSALVQLLWQLLLLPFALVLTPRFDDVVDSGFGIVRGEQILFWFPALVLVVGTAFLAWFVRETKPANFVPDAAASPQRILVDMFRGLLANRRLWPIYLIGVAGPLAAGGLGPIDSLLVTEQWGYSKQDMGTTFLMGALVNIAFIPLIGVLADRIDRIKFFATGIVVIFTTQLAYVLWIKIGLPDERPALHHMVFFGTIIALGGQIISTCMLPLAYDYIPRAQMGTAQAGFNIMRSVTRLTTLNGTGLWVVWWSRFALGPGETDYFSGYYFLLFANVVSAGLFLIFVRQARSGRLPRAGREGLAEGGAA